MKSIRNRAAVVLIEAVVMIVLAGSCLVPVLGSLTHGIERAGAIRLRTAMQNIAESKINEIIDNCSYAGVTPINETITIPYPNATYPEYNFVLTVEVNHPVNLLEYESSASGLDGGQPPDFKEVSVVVSLQETEPEIEPVSLYTMLSKPKAPGDMIYAACPGTKTIKVISPKTHILVEEYLPPAALAEITQLSGITLLAAVGDYVPLHLAVHPAGEWLAIKSTTQIFLMDIRINSLTRGKVWCIIDAIGTLCSSVLVENSSDPGETNTRLDRGIVFRSDGKYLFFTDRTGKIYAFEVPAALPGATRWTQKQIFTGQNQPIGFLELCDNQNLYVGYMNSGAGDNFMAFNTHTFTPENFGQPTYTHGKQAHQRGLTSTWGGHEFFEMYCGFFIGRFNKWAPTDCEYGTLTGNTYPASHDHRHNSPLVSPDNIWVAIPQATGGNQEHCGFFRRPFNTATLADQPGTWNRSAKTNATDLLTHSRHSPWKKELILKGITSKIYFPLWSEVAAGTTGNYGGADSMPVMDLVDIPSDVNARIPEFVHVACANNAIEVIDIYGGGTGRLDESKKITLSAAPVHISTTAGADIGVVCYSASNQPDKIDHADDSTTAMALTNGGSYSVMAAHTLNRALVVGVKSAGATPVMGEMNTPTNGVIVYEPDDFGNIVNTPVCGYAMPSSFVVKAVIPMHRRDGAYVLMQDTTSSPKESVVIWIEKSAQGGLGGSEGTVKYRIMNVWRGKYDGFPEGAPCQMALSPDDTILALYDWTNTAGNTKQVIRLYDLNNQRFPMQEGLVINRFSSSSGSFAATPTDASHNLKGALTKFTTITPINAAFPYNFYSSSTGLGVSSKTLRFFGTWYHTSFSALGLAGEDGSRFCFNGNYYLSATYNTGTLWSDGGSDETWGFNISATAGASHFQGDYYSVNDAPENNGFAYSTSSLGSTPSHANANPITFSGGSGAWNNIPASQFRAFRFRPQMLKEIFLDGTIWGGDPSTGSDNVNLPDESANNGNPDWFTMCFNRDTARPVLLFIHNTISADKLYGLGLFGEANWSAKSLVDAESWKMAVSPDGRRVLLASTISTTYKAYLIDIAYTIPYATPDLPTAPTTAIDLPGAPVSLAVRPFNSFASKPNDYYLNDTDSVVSNDRSGNHTAALAKNGIYIMAGSDGFTGSTLRDCYRYDAITDNVYSMGTIPDGTNGRSLPAVVSYDNKVFLFGGKKTTTAGSECAEVMAYDTNSGSWLWNNTTPRFVHFQTNANNDLTTKGIAISLTPYGIVLMGGDTGGTCGNTVHVYYPDARMNTSAPAQYGETLALPSHPSFCIAHSSAVTHFSKKDKKWYLYRIGGGEPVGIDKPALASAGSYSRFDFDANTWSSVALPQSSLDRNGVAACSWGDEIFIFGGAEAGTARITGFAWNPDTNFVRPLKDLPQLPGDSNEIRPCWMSAVPCGPFIYLIDGTIGINTTGSTRYIRRYKP